MEDDPESDFNMYRGALFWVEKRRVANTEVEDKRVLLQYRLK